LFRTFSLLPPVLGSPDDTDLAADYAEFYSRACCTERSWLCDADFSLDYIACRASGWSWYNTAGYLIVTDGIYKAEVGSQTF